MATTFVVCDEEVYTQKNFNKLKLNPLVNLLSLGKQWWIIKANSPEEANSIADVIVAKEAVHPISLKLNNLNHWIKYSSVKKGLDEFSDPVDIINTVLSFAGIGVFEANQILNNTSVKQIAQKKSRERTTEYRQNYYKLH